MIFGDLGGVQMVGGYEPPTPCVYLCIVFQWLLKVLCRIYTKLVFNKQVYSFGHHL